MKKNICFIGNCKKTYFFTEIAKQLADSCNVFWIVYNQHQYDQLVCEYDPSNVLLISKSIGFNDSNKIGEYKLNELIRTDRLLQLYPSFSYELLKNIQIIYYNYIRDNNISYVFGETTFAHEVLLMRIIKDKSELNCKYLHPQTIRIPAFHFTFLEDEFQSKIFFKQESDLSQNQIIKVSKPSEYYVVEKRVNKALNISGKFKRLLRFLTFKNMDVDDPYLTPFPFKRYLYKGVTEEINRLSYTLFVKRESKEVLTAKKFVVYTLHKQPEASVDVVGRYYDDQYINIYNIWRILPDDISLVIKEHTNAIGDRGKRFFKKVKRLRNTVILHETVNSHFLIEKCEAIFTVSGTIAYEAALLNKQAFMFVPIFFDKIQNIHPINVEEFREITSFQDLMKNARQTNSSKLNIKDYSKYILTRSYNGLISDPLTDIRCMEEENIKQVSSAFKHIIQ